MNLPNCFEDFKSGRVMLDCIEIHVAKPKCLCCRVKLYSNYKARSTMKVMSGVSSGGLITFVSKAYGGRSSDKAIFEKSGIVDKLESHVDFVMVDKGFIIDGVCHENFIQVSRP